MSNRVNVADRLHDLPQQCRCQCAVGCARLLVPDQMTGAVPITFGSGITYGTITFANLDVAASRLARGLVAMGLRPGTRVALLVPPGVEFVALVFALLRAGAVTIFVDPGMGRRNLIECLAAAEPEGFVGMSKAHAVRTLLRGKFPLAKYNVTVGRRWWWDGPTVGELGELGDQSIELPDTTAEDSAAIIFTSGSTGPPKGVLYTHGMFDTQVAEIQSRYDIQPGEIDLACFPLFGLFNSAMGVTTVLPPMNFSRPASANPQKLLTTADDWKVTQSFASPAVWDKLSAYCETHHKRITTLKHVFSCGAPVPANLLKRTLRCTHPDAQMHTPYGATECLPVSTIEATEVLQETADQTDAGAGICVGRPFDTIDWRVIRITDEPIANIAETEQLPLGEIGELIILGPQASPKYTTLVRVAGHGKSTAAGADPNPLAKIPDGKAHWHRMGDVGYLDTKNRFWYCGRKSQRVLTCKGTLYTIPVEAQLNKHAYVRRSALIGVGRRGSQQACIIFEADRRQYETTNSDQVHVNSLFSDVASAAHELLHPHPIGGVWGYPGRLPVDVRHNAKIRREELAAWASRRLRQRVSPTPDP